MKKGLPLEELDVYKVSMEIGEIVWTVVSRWDQFNRNTLGNQFTRAADSISFNISEGYGRYFYKENRNFCYYSRGSAKETLTATVKARNRQLITSEEYQLLLQKLGSFFRLVYGYIQSIGRSGNEE